MASGVVKCDPESRSYTLPTEHVAFLTRAASPNNIPVISNFIGVAASIEKEMVARFGDDE